MTQFTKIINIRNIHNSCHIYIQKVAMNIWGELGKCRNITFRKKERKKERKKKKIVSIGII
jgi:hypothetical protein